MSAFTLFVLLAAIAVGTYVIKTIRSPLNQVVDAIKHLSKGDLRAKIEFKSVDELGVLADCTRDLIKKMREILQAIQVNSEHLASAAEQTSRVAEDSLKNINQQTQETEMVASAITEMYSTVNEVAGSCSKTLTYVESTSDQTKKGKEIVNENISSVKSLSAEIGMASGVIDKVSEESENIGSVLDVIRGIAEQTNLLALNAAIEAARAGEQGRGFAVVADEVRTLASRSQLSTAEIQEIILRLQNGAREAVKVMKMSCENAQRSVDSIAGAGTSRSRIDEAVNTIKDMSTQIASASEEQNCVTKELHKNISNIARAAESNAEGAKENLSASKELARLAEYQRQLVSQFVLA